MFTILDKLNKTRGIKGSMIVNRDGIVVASDFSVDCDEEAIGAVSSSIFQSLEGALKKIKLGKFKRFVITGRDNRILLVDSGPSLLLVLLDKDVNLGLVSVEIKDAVDAIVVKATL